MRYAWLPLVILLMGVNSCELWEKQPSDNWVEHDRLRAKIQQLQDAVDSINSKLDDIKRSCR